MLPRQTEGHASRVSFKDVITVSAKNQAVQCAHRLIIIHKQNCFRADSVFHMRALRRFRLLYLGRRKRTHLNYLPYLLSISTILSMYGDFFNNSKTTGPSLLLE